MINSPRGTFNGLTILAPRFCGSGLGARRPTDPNLRIWKADVGY
jgi:hypothetical protein